MRWFFQASFSQNNASFSCICCAINSECLSTFMIDLWLPMVNIITYAYVYIYIYTHISYEHIPPYTQCVIVIDLVQFTQLRSYHLMSLRYTSVDLIAFTIIINHLDVLPSLSAQFQTWCTPKIGLTSTKPLGQTAHHIH